MDKIKEQTDSEKNERRNECPVKKSLAGRSIYVIGTNHNQALGLFYKWSQICLPPAQLGNNLVFT
jgi:hypothetical protein